jgi:hypothetical protein
MKVFTSRQEAEAEMDKVYPQDPNTMPEIQSISAFLVLDPADNNEGIIACDLPGSRGMPMPLIGADAERIESLRPIAQQIANVKGVPVRLVRFSVREVIEVLEPKHREAL